MVKKWYKVHFYDQDVFVEANEEAEAEFMARESVECDAIDETCKPEDY